MGLAEVFVRTNGAVVVPNGAVVVPSAGHHLHHRQSSYCWRRHSTTTRLLSDLQVLAQRQLGGSSHEKSKSARFYHYDWRGGGRGCRLDGHMGTSSFCSETGFCSGI